MRMEKHNILIFVCILLAPINEVNATVNPSSKSVFCDYCETLVVLLIHFLVLRLGAVDKNRELQRSGESITKNATATDHTPYDEGPYGPTRSAVLDRLAFDYEVSSDCKDQSLF